MNTVFHLIRHAAHDQLGQFLTGRSAGVQLSQQGRAEAEAAARRLSTVEFDAFRTSPQPRARETAEIVAAPHGLAPELSEALDEIDFGAWAGQPFAALEDDLDWKSWNRDRGSARTPGGEAMPDVATRLVALVDMLRNEFPGGIIGLVSHCDVIKAGVCHYLGLPFERLDRFEIDPASTSTIVVGDWGGKVLALNVASDGGATGAAQ